MVCEGKAWISSFSPIPGVYGNSDEASLAAFGHQNSVKMMYMMISTGTFHVKIHIPKLPCLAQVFVVSLPGFLAGCVTGHKCRAQQSSLAAKVSSSASTW